MIARDEERNLGACLESLGDCADEIVVVDTGSSDRTVEIARAHGAKVIASAWYDDFSRARNESLAAATCDWILWLDADDRVPSDEIARIAALKTLPADRAFGFVLVNVAPGRFDERWLQLRMFPNDPRIRFYGRVHEQVAKSVLAAHLPIYFLDVEIVHTGHADPELREHKERRNLRLLELDVAERPDDLHQLYCLADALASLGERARAMDLLRRVHAEINRESPLAAQSAVRLAQCFSDLGDLEEAAAWVDRALEKAPGKIDAMFVGAQVALRRGDTATAVALLDVIAHAPPPSPTTCVPDVAPLRALALVFLARIRRRADDLAQAESLYRDCIRDFPMLVDPYLELADLLAQGDRFAEAASLRRSAGDVPISGSDRLASPSEGP
jgi:tetratricopeptide (TPR) repeat protein